MALLSCPCQERWRRSNLGRGMRLPRPSVEGLAMIGGKGASNDWKKEGGTERGGRGKPRPRRIDVKELISLAFSLQYGGSALAAANAGGCQTVFPFFEIEYSGARAHQPGAAGSQRVSDGGSATLDVDFLGVDA
jgi:hypothetical protein